MKCSNLLAPIKRLPSRSEIVCLLAFLTSCLWAAQSAQADHPQVDIACNPAGSTPTAGFVPFSLYWDDPNNPGSSSWPNYLFVDLYDSTGAELPGYPQEDATVYHVPTSTSPYPTEPDTATGAVTQKISVSGKYNGDACPRGGIELRDRDQMPCCPPGIAACCLANIGPPKPAPKPWVGFDVPFAVPNISGKNEMWVFSYAVFKKPKGEDDDPVKVQDQWGHSVHRLTKNHNDPTADGRYTVPPAGLQISDLRIDLSHNVIKKDYVYVEIFPTNLSNSHVRCRPVRVRLQ